jgi:hypothetical protein
MNCFSDKKTQYLHIEKAQLRQTQGDYSSRGGKFGLSTLKSGPDRPQTCQLSEELPFGPIALALFFQALAPITAASWIGSRQNHF